MTKRKTRKKMGRPEIEWNEEDINLFKQLCQIMCTEEEICSVMGINKMTLVKLINKYLYEDITGHKLRGNAKRVDFLEAFKKYSAFGRKSLRRKQMKVALDGNVTMLIWLGKQYLGQMDQPEDNYDMEDSDAFFSEAGL